MLEKDFEASGKKFEEYLLVCERLGKEPDLSKMPMDRNNYPYEVQMALLIHEHLPDRWEGMSGSYLGKDWSSVEAFLNSYDVDDKQSVLFFIKAVDVRHSVVLNKELERERKKKESPQGKSTIHKRNYGKK